MSWIEMKEFVGAALKYATLGVVCILLIPLVPLILVGAFAAYLADGTL